MCAKSLMTNDDSDVNIDASHLFMHSSLHKHRLMPHFRLRMLETTNSFDAPSSCTLFVYSVLLATPLA